LSSANPDATIIAALTPALPQRSSSSGTVAAGIVSTARSTRSGSSAIDRYAFNPCTSAWLRLTG
jgi:hypothetical protein